MHHGDDLFDEPWEEILGGVVRISSDGTIEWIGECDGGDTDRADVAGEGELLSFTEPRPRHHDPALLVGRAERRRAC